MLSAEETVLLVVDVQEKLSRVLADYRVPWGATVLLEPRTGRVLALAEHSQRDPEARGLSFRAMAPAASIFKIVTTAALLQRGVGPEAEVCYHGGKHGLSPRHLADDPRRDRRCLTLASALGHSANAVFAKLADRGLSAELLRSEAEHFLWNAPIPFARPVEVSRADIPDDPFSLAQTAEGALNEVNNILTRMRELAVQSANGTMSTTDRATIDTEFQALSSEIDWVTRQRAGWFFSVNWYDE